MPDTVRKHQIPQYVAHQAEEFERLVKNGFCEDSSMRIEEYARRWLKRQSRYAPSTLASYRRMLEVVFPYIGAIPLCRLRPINMENLLAELRKRTCHGKPVQETTVQKYLTVVSAVLSDAKRNEILEKNPAHMVALPQTQRSIQRVPSQAEVQKLLDALAREPRHYRLFYLLSLYTGCRRGELCALQWSDFIFRKDSLLLTISRSRSNVAGKGIVEGSTKNGRSREIYLSGDLCGSSAAITIAKRWRPSGPAASSAPISSPTNTGSLFTPILSPSGYGKSTSPSASPRNTTFTPYATTS